METIKVSDFSHYPGPRYVKLGKYSGEEFRDEKLIPAIKVYGDSIQIDLDGVAGYGSSFLDEAFAGLIRCGVEKSIVLRLVENLKSDDDPYRIEEIKEYVDDQIKAKN
ncbi:STAS-like domain-containing protein [Pseudoalteromonas sp. Z1A8]|uniref:STAS-like domain-containing protein n=1 Tax=Pseudoalteromonas sp. Z1A8 TaxID=2686354 RepID=UPI001407ED1C